MSPPEPITPLSGVALAPLTTIGLGGAARWYVRATSVELVCRACRWADERGIDILVLGGGSNLVVADEGWHGLVVHIAIHGVTVTAVGSGARVEAGAGESWDAVVEMAVSHGLVGIECLSGIPGTVGGTPVQNVGAYGQEVAAVIEGVTALDRATGAIVRLTGSECGFGYRTSRFKQAASQQFVLCGVTFRLGTGKPTVAYPDVISFMRQHAIMSPGVRDVRDAVMAIRRRKGMVLDASDPDTRSVGSFFVNPVVSSQQLAHVEHVVGGRAPSFPVAEDGAKIPAAWLIERSGFSAGFIAGSVGLSTKHPLAIVNRGGASARDVVQLASRIKRGVADRFNIWLQSEPVFVGAGTDPDVAYLQEARN